jgi:ABC-type glycerol-3-phosphate transport system substrate-binding protein
MRDQLEEYAVDADKTSRTLSSYKSNISACGEWIADATDQPLAIDRMMLRSADAQKMKTSSGFWDGVAFEIKRFFYSYIVDYTKIGNTSNDAGTLTLWVGSGRDQAGAIKQLLEESFTPATGVKVNLQLVDMGTLLQAVMSGQGPDAAFQVGEATNSLTYGQRYGQMSVDLPVNYGLRGAVADLRMFEDFEAVSNRFAESALTSMEFGGAAYALPETQSFPVMFYRKDILAELNLALPQTWEDVEKAIAVMARNQMVFGLAPSEQTFATFLFQCGGSYYNADATASALSEPAAIRAFKAYCEYFTDYRLDKELGSGATGGGLSQRFRTGEAPIAIADFGLYNELQVSAPELRGLWGIGLVPGTEVEGRIDRSVACGGTSCIILNASKNKSEAWELLKWWTSKETQTRYARQMESLMGAAARVPASNLEAFDSLPWPAKDLITLNEQREFAKGIQQAPGGYITYRNVNNAFFLATVGISSPIGGVDGNKTLSTPEEALTDKVILIDEEIAYKRMEFNLDSATS